MKTSVQYVKHFWPYIHLYTAFGSFNICLLPGYRVPLKTISRKNYMKTLAMRATEMEQFITLFSKCVCRTARLIILFISAGQAACKGGPRCSTMPGFYFSSSFPFIIFPSLSLSSYSFRCNCTPYHLSFPSLSL